MYRCLKMGFMSAGSVSLLKIQCTYIRYIMYGKPQERGHRLKMDSCLSMCDFNVSKAIFCSDWR